MKTPARIALALTLASAALGTLSSHAMAETPWQHDHRQRTEVNDRLAHQNQRIGNEVRTGKINQAQAHALRTNDHAVRSEEHAMAAQDRGHITRTDQHALNQQLNRNSAAIGK